MLPSLQPSRPRLQAPPHVSPPYQQKRPEHNQPKLPSETKITPPPPPPAQKPKSQVEAMPPFGSPMALRQTMTTSEAMSNAAAMYDAAVRHPVFFTDSLRKPPFALPPHANHGVHPVASGYIYEDRRTPTLSRTKL